MVIIIIIIIIIFVDFIGKIVQCIYQYQCGQSRGNLVEYEIYEKIYS